MMDSASSGSMQSSSGGGGGCGGGAGGGDNDEYDSHGGELMSSFLKCHNLSSPKPQQPPPPPPNFFDLSYILDSNFQQNANFHLNFGNFSSTSLALATSTSQSPTVVSQSNPCNYNNINQAPSSIHLLSTNEESNNYKIPDEQKNIIGIKNNSKKRSRASRRAPTTILTTDTINFRQMVQEFTGIPAPPFITNRGFDLFSRSGTSNMRNGSSYPLRPSPQKGSSSTPPSLLNSRLINARTDFSLPPNLKQPHQNQTEDAFNNMQNQYGFPPLQESTISSAFNDRSHGGSTMVAPTDLDGLGGIHNHHL